MAIISTDITEKPLRKIFATIDDTTFKTALVSLHKNELNLLKRLYGKDYCEVNIINLSNDEVTLLLKLLNQTIPEKIKMISEYQKKEYRAKEKAQRKSIYDDSLFKRISRLDPKLWEPFITFLKSEEYHDMLKLLDPLEAIIWALRYGVIKNNYAAESIAYILDTDEDTVTKKLSFIHTKLGIKNSK